MFICFCLAISAFAEETSAANREEKKIAKIDDIVVTATKTEESKKDVSAAVQVMSAEDIKNSTAKNAADLITESGVGHVHKYNGGLASMVEVRGLQTDMFNPEKSRVLILINGSNAGTVNLAAIPTDDIERIEIVKGPASVLYGSSAMGGVINIITKKGRGGFHASVGGELGSWNYWKTATDVSGKKDRFDYYVAASRSARDNYKTKDYGTINNTGYDDETVSARLGYNLFSDHHVSVGYQHWKGWDMGSAGPTYDLDPDNYTDRERNSFDVNYKAGTFTAKYYHIKDNDTSHGGMMAGPGNSEIYDADIYTQGVNLQKNFAIGDHRIIIGGQWDRIKSVARSNQGAPYYPDSKYDSYGLFTEGRLSLFNKRLLVNAGLRYDYFENEMLATAGLASDSRKERMDHVTARGGLVYKITNDLGLKGNVGTAYRAPAPLELAADYMSWGTHYVGNPDLKPEKSITYDAGIDYSKGAFKADFTYFYTDFDDKIVGYYDTVRAVSTYKNAPGATIQGIELNASFDVGAALGWPVILEPFANITYKFTYKQENEGAADTTLTYTPKWTGAFGLRVGQEKWDARLIANYVGHEDVTDFNYISSSTYGQVINKGGFAVFGLKGTYRPVKNIELMLSVENLLDRNYEYVQYYPMPGRSVIGGAKWIF
ncbi:MAG: TonB-dependent receptor [Smithella sp.]